MRIDSRRQGASLSCVCAAVVCLSPALLHAQTDDDPGSQHLSQTSADKQPRSIDQHDALATDVPIIDAQHERAQLDADRFFDDLVDRYQGLVSYEDHTQVVRELNQDGQPLQRTETHLCVTIDSAGQLQVTSVVSPMHHMIGSMIPLRISNEAEQLASSYALWQAPHMALYICDVFALCGEPFITPAMSSMSPVDARATTLDDHEVVQLRLSDGAQAARAQSSGTAPVAGDVRQLEPRPDATSQTFDLFVNPHSMLIERIVSDELLSDGTQQKTTIDISPRRSQSGIDSRWSAADAPNAVSSAGDTSHPTTDGDVRSDGMERSEAGDTRSEHEAGADDHSEDKVAGGEITGWSSGFGDPNGAPLFDIG